MSKKIVITCSHCSQQSWRKNGIVQGIQRYYCKVCGKNFTTKPKRIAKETKRFALLLYLNNMGIRKIAKIVNVSPPAVLRWIRNAHSQLQNEVQPFAAAPDKGLDVIELDEIYTFIKKNETGLPYGLLTLEGKSVLLRLK